MVRGLDGYGSVARSNPSPNTAWLQNLKKESHKKPWLCSIFFASNSGRNLRGFVPKCLCFNAVVARIFQVGTSTDGTVRAVRAPSLANRNIGPAQQQGKAWIMDTTNDFISASIQFVVRQFKRSSARRRNERIAVRNARRPRMEGLEKRTLLSVSILNGGGLGYVGDAHVGDGGDPPDTCGAAGPSSYIESTNAFISIFTPKASGTTVVSQDPTSFFFATGGLPLLGTPNEQKIADVTIVYDNLMGGTGRFILGNIDVDTTADVSQYVFAVSKSNNPTTLTTADWNFYHVTTTEGSGSQLPILVRLSRQPWLQR